MIAGGCCHDDAALAEEDINMAAGRRVTGDLREARTKGANCQMRKLALFCERGVASAPEWRGKSACAKHKLLTRTHPSRHMTKRRVSKYDVGATANQASIRCD